MKYENVRWDEEVKNKTLNDMLDRKIAKRNDIIQHSRYALSNAQNKTLSYMLSLIAPNDPPEKMYRVYYRDIIKLLNWSKHGISDVKKLIKKVADSSVYVQIQNGKETLVRWLDLVNVDEIADDDMGVGYIEYTFHKTVQPYIFELQKQKVEKNAYYSTVTLRDSALMKNKYSPRIYEILKSYQYNNQKWCFEIGTGSCNDLYLMIADVDKNGESCIPVNWSKYAEFERSVLKKVKEDINKYSDIRIDYTPLKVDFSGKKHRKNVAVEFVMCGKTKDEIEERDSYIKEEYRNFLKEEENEQIALVDLLKKNESKKKSKEPKISFFKKRFPVFCEEFEEYGFSEKQLKRLQQLACENKHVNIPNQYVDVWVTDYVSYYYDEIMASAEATKTSIYARLKDCVEKDYKNRGYASSQWEEKENAPEIVDVSEDISAMPEIVEVVDGDVVDIVNDTVNNGVDPVLSGIVFLSDADSNKAYKENLYRSEGLIVQIVPQKQYLEIKAKTSKN